MKNNNTQTIQPLAAKAFGVINKDGYVTYNVLNKDGAVIAVAQYPFLDSVEATLAARCCFFGSVPYISDAGIRVEIQSENGHIAKLVIPPTCKLVTSAMNGAACLEDIDTPYACSVASENYWCS